MKSKYATLFTFPIHIPDFSVHNTLVQIIPRQKIFYQNSINVSISETWHHKSLFFFNSSPSNTWLQSDMQFLLFTIPSMPSGPFLHFYFLLNMSICHTLCQIKYNCVSCWLHIFNIWKKSIALLRLHSASVFLMPFSKKQFRNLCCLITHDELKVICHVL